MKLPSTFLLVLCSQFFFYKNSLAQNENSNWYFGQGLSLNFDNGMVQGGVSSLSATGINQPTIMSDANGNVICYSDGNKIFNGANTQIHDFVTSTPENLIVPNPADLNQFYIFRSGSTGLNYSVIDMTLNGGVGGIGAQEDIPLGEFNSQLVCATMDNGNGFWLIAADNQNGSQEDMVNIQVYAITTNGIAYGDMEGQTYILAHQYASLDDMRIAPDCSKIAIAYKGHFLVLVRFDNVLGTLYDLLTLPLNAPGSWQADGIDQWEFSGDASFIYNLADHVQVTRYNLLAWNINQIFNSHDTIVASDPVFGFYWTDLKLAIDGKIYLCNRDSSQIDALSNTSSMDVNEIVYTPAVVQFDLAFDYYFPNLPNVLCHVLEPGVYHQYECLGDSTELWYAYTQDADSVLWDFDDPASGIFNTSIQESPIHVFSDIGQYLVLLHLYVDGQEIIFTHIVNISEVLPFELGPAVVLCAGTTLDIGPEPTPGLTYNWNTGSTDNIITIAGSGNYALHVNIGNCAKEDQIAVTLIPEIITSMPDTIVFCVQQLFVLQSNAQNADAYIWNTGSNSSFITVNSSGTYSVTASNECFSHSDSTLVYYAIIPELLDDIKISVCNGDTLHLALNYDNGQAIWSNGEFMHEIVVTQSGTYTVEVNDMGCVATDEIEIEIAEFFPLSWIEVPNIFTPNGDGLNETFEPFVIYNPSFELCTSAAVEVSINVYNRWGNLLSEDNCSWNGKAPNGGICSEGVYYYIIDISNSCADRKEHEQHDGFVHLKTGQ